jgi:hypothetical protein
MRLMNKISLGAAALAGSVILSLSTGALAQDHWDRDHCDRYHCDRYRDPHFVEQRPVYVPPRPVYVAPAPVIVAPVVPVAPMPVGPPSLNMNLNIPL